MKKFDYRFGKRHFVIEQTNRHKRPKTPDGKVAYWSAYEIVLTVIRCPQPKLLGHTVTVGEAKALIEMVVSQTNSFPLSLPPTTERKKQMQHKKDDFDPNEPHIIAHSRVQVLASANWPDTTIPIFALGIRINLSLMEGEDGVPWLRIHRSPDRFNVIERTSTKVRLQHDWIWVEIAPDELDVLLAKAGNAAKITPIDT